MKIPNQDTPFVGQSLKLETAEHEERFLTNRQRRTVTQ
jgi:hypothetical protein